LVRGYLVGAGVIAREHAAASHLLGEAAELHVCDPNPAALAAFTSHEPGAIIHDSVDAMLSEPARADDIVVVATPPQTHADLAIRGFASARHVLCEKPLGMDLEQAQRMLRAARAAGKHLGDCSMRFLGYEAEDFIRATLRTGQLGPLYHVTCRHRTQRGRSGIEYQPESRWFLDRSKSGGGVLVDWSVYDLATLFDLLEPVRVEVRDAWIAQPRTGADPGDVVFDVETHVGASMRLTLADRSTLALSYERASATHGAAAGDLLEIEGRDGAIDWEWLPYLAGSTAALVRLDQAGKPTEEEHRFSSEGTVNWHHRPLLFFHQKVRGSTSAPAIANERALFNYAVIQAMYGVAATGQAQVVDMAEIG
jgi:predicted dehydrogenase